MHCNTSACLRHPTTTASIDRRQNKRGVQLKVMTLSNEQF